MPYLHLHRPHKESVLRGPHLVQGMGFPQISVNKVMPPFHNMIEQVRGAPLLCSHIWRFVSWVSWLGFSSRSHSLFLSHESNLVSQRLCRLPKAKGADHHRISGADTGQWDGNSFLCLSFLRDPWEKVGHQLPN